MERTVADVVAELERWCPPGTADGWDRVGLVVGDPAAPVRHVHLAVDPTLGVVYPSDYTLVLSRVAFISKRAKNKNAARLWLDYMLSVKGQDILANQSDIASIRNDVPGDNDVDGLTKKPSTSVTAMTSPR